MELKFKQQYETKIFVSDDGYLCIEQASSSDHGATDYVNLTRYQAEALRDFLDEAFDRWPGDDE